MNQHANHADSAADAPAASDDDPGQGGAGLGAGDGATGTASNPDASESGTFDNTDDLDDPEALPAGDLSIELILETDDVDPPVTGWLEPMLAKAAFLASAPGGHINLLLVGDGPMAEYHAQYCGVPGTTDVITFDHRDEAGFADDCECVDAEVADATDAEATDADCEDDDAYVYEDQAEACEGWQMQVPLEGDLILCVDEAKRQAAQRGHSTRQELLLYAVHGLMHLLGEDDHNEDDYEQMHAREDQILTAMGQGPLFHSRVASDAAQAATTGNSADPSMD